MICKKCGSEIPDDARFCSKCGEKVQTDEAETSTREKVSEFVVDLKKKVESSEKINEIKEKIASNEKIGELKEKIESNEKINEIKEKIESNEKINELKEKIASNETINDLKENLSSKERLSALMSNITATKIVFALLIIFAAMKFFGGSEDLGLTAKEFANRYNQNLEVMFPGIKSNGKITGITEGNSFIPNVRSYLFEFANGTILANTDGENINLGEVRIVASSDKIPAYGAVAVCSITHKNPASRDDIFEAMEMIQKLMRDSANNYSYSAFHKTEVGEAEIVKNGISCSILFSGTASSLTIQTAKHASMNAEKTR